jgi:hypothetical protein
MRARITIAYLESSKTNTENVHVCGERSVMVSMSMFVLWYAQVMDCSES